MSAAAARKPRSLAVADLLPPKPESLFNHCYYCGLPCYGRFCKQHRALAQTDPYVQMSRPRTET